MSGDNTVNNAGVYGTQDVAAPGNKPGARCDSVSWTDADGDLWLFGGYGYDSAGGEGDLNDLWKYDTSTGLWTWVSGDSTVNNAGVYGTKGVAAPGNKPGARSRSVSWTDADGDLWLFGGYGYDSAGGEGRLNDLWKYKIVGYAYYVDDSATGTGDGTSWENASNSLSAAIDAARVGDTIHIAQGTYYPETVGYIDPRMATFTMKKRRKHRRRLRRLHRRRSERTRHRPV